MPRFHSSYSFSSLCDIAGIPHSDFVDGVSLRPILVQPSAPGHAGLTRHMQHDHDHDDQPTGQTKLMLILIRVVRPKKPRECMTEREIPFRCRTEMSTLAGMTAPRKAVEPYRSLMANGCAVMRGTRCDH